jgi:T-complex protein 1 subunit alpha
VGDGTTSVVIFAAELLRRANELVRARIHPTTIMSGYRMAVKEAVKYIKSHLTVSTDKMEREYLVNAARTSMSSKILGSQNSEFFAAMAVDSVMSVRKETPEGPKYPIGNIHIVKSHGKSAMESTLVRGLALPQARVSQQMPKTVRGAKIALLDFNLQRHRLQLGVQVLVTDPAQLEAIRQREADITKEKIAKICGAGANVVFTTKAIDDLCQKYLVERGVLAVRRASKKDLQRIAAATGGTLMANLADLEGGETLDPKCLGTAEGEQGDARARARGLRLVSSAFFPSLAAPCPLTHTHSHSHTHAHAHTLTHPPHTHPFAEVAEERVGDNDVVFVRGPLHTKAVSILLRGANDFLLDEMDRSLHDVLCVVQRVLESKSVVAGGGAVEAALSMYLESYATTLATKEQLAIREFADALLAIPRTLAVNAAKDSTELVAKLCAFHTAAQASAEKSELRFMGLDLIKGAVVNNLAVGVVEPAMSKVKSLKFATEAAITILRIDDFIKISPPQTQ